MEAKQNEFLVDGRRLIAHQGSAIYQIQYPYSFLARLYDSIGLKRPELKYQRWAGRDPQIPVSRTPYEAALVLFAVGSYAYADSSSVAGRVVDPQGANVAGAKVI